ncbi:HNH endonuclease signature motif containing protein [Pseudactinotalea sp. Z1748]|uniref:HNH endonuclease signature motif containing protein n=1 Tax=Pseudactinotalea sp. Z1748 TaxID=3413027 RepID=UPI003C7D708B
MTATIALGTLTERFWSKISECPRTGCWNWTAAHNSTGYGQWAVDGTSKSVHRLTYQALVGPIPAEFHVDHLCRNKSCCNPQHLEAVPQEVNAARAAAVITHCKQGHPLSGANLRRRGNKRGCRTCDRASAAAHRERTRKERALSDNPVRRYRKRAS